MSRRDANKCAFQENEIYTFKDTLRENSPSNMSKYEYEHEHFCS